MTFEEGMKQSIEELVEKKTTLEKRCFELEQRNSELYINNEKQMDKIEKLEQENENLKMGLQYDSDNRDDILKENSDLQQKYLEESFEKSKLVKEKSKIEDINLKLREQNNELVEENGTLKTQVSILQGKNKGLKELIKGYENTRDRMIAMGFPTFKSVKEYAAKLKELEAQLDIIRDERNYFQEKCEDIELNYYCDHKEGCKAQELEAQIEKMNSDYDKLLDEKIELEDRLAESRECY